jgi:hypothetical protein
MDKLPIFRFIVGEDDEAQLEAVAFVDSPAIEMNWQAFNSNQYKFKAEVEKRIISGPLMVAELPIYRRDESGEYYGVFQKEDIYNLRNKFFKQGKSNLVNEMHDSSKMIDGVYMIESFLIDKERGINAPKGYELTDGSWFGSYKIDNDEIWNDFIKSGEFKGFSVEGLFKTVKIDEQPESTVKKIIDVLHEFFGGPGSGRRPEEGSDSEYKTGLGEGVDNYIEKIENSNEPPTFEDLSKLRESNKDAYNVAVKIDKNWQNNPLSENEKVIFDKMTTKKDYELYRGDTRYTINTTKIGDTLDFESKPTFTSSNIEHAKGFAKDGVIVFEKGTTKSVRRKFDTAENSELIRGSYKVTKIEDGKIYVKPK